MQFMPALLLVALLVGCARFEHEIVAPPEAVGRVARQADHRAAIEPLEYRMRTVDNRLVMRVYNQTNANITLLGSRSSVVDPGGQSHPLQSQTIAPDSFIRIILPPPRPRVYRGGPTIGVGVGTRIGASPRRHNLALAHAHTHPRYMAVYDDSNAIYWDWRGEGQVRLSLVYTRGEPEDQRAGTFTHNFIIRRIRAR